MFKALRLINQHGVFTFISKSTAAANVFKKKDRMRQSTKSLCLSPSARFANIPEGFIWRSLNHSCLTSCGMALCCLDKEELEVDVPEGDQVPEGAQPVGFTGKTQLIKYLYWDFTDEDMKL